MLYPTKLGTTLIAMATAIAITGAAHAQTPMEDCDTARGAAATAVDENAQQMGQVSEDGARQQLDAAANARDAGDYARCIEIATEVMETVRGATGG